jgi:hypothetical protein
MQALGRKVWKANVNRVLPVSVGKALRVGNIETEKREDTWRG